MPVLKFAQAAGAVVPTNPFPLLGKPRLAPKVINGDFGQQANHESRHLRPVFHGRSAAFVAEYLPPLLPPPPPKPKKPETPKKPQHGATFLRLIARLKRIISL